MGRVGVAARRGRHRNHRGADRVRSGRCGGIVEPGRPAVVDVRYPGGGERGIVEVLAEERRAGDGRAEATAGAAVGAAVGAAAVGGRAPVSARVSGRRLAGRCFGAPGAAGEVVEVREQRTTRCRRSTEHDAKGNPQRKRHAGSVSPPRSFTPRRGCAGRRGCGRWLASRPRSRARDATCRCRSVRGSDGARPLPDVTRRAPQSGRR